MNAHPKSFLRRYCWVLVAGVGILLIAGYTLWSGYTWSRYEKNHQNWRLSVKSEVEKALALPAKDEKSRTAKLTALAKVSDTITKEKDTVCHVNTLVGWQQVMKALKEKQEWCQRSAAGIESFNTHLAMVTEYLKEEAGLTKVLSSLSGEKVSLSESEWQAQATAWHSALEATSKLTAHGSFTPTKQKAVEVVTNVDGAWQALLAAHAAKDKTKYNDAQAALVRVYSTLGELSSFSANQLNPLLKTLQKSYKTAFTS